MFGFKTYFSLVKWTWTGMIFEGSQINFNTAKTCSMLTNITNALNFSSVFHSVLTSREVGCTTLDFKFFQAAWRWFYSPLPLIGLSCFFFFTVLRKLLLFASKIMISLVQTRSPTTIADTWRIRLSFSCHYGLIIFFIISKGDICFVIFKVF